MEKHLEKGREKPTDILRADLERAADSELSRIGVTAERLAQARRDLLDRFDREIPALLDERLDRIRRDVVQTAQSEEARERRRRELEEAREARREEMVLRVPLQLRIQHVILFSSCLLLILTGLPLKFSELTISVYLVHLFGGIERSTLLHRVGATGLVIVAIYHTLFTIFTKDGRRNILLLLPRPKDALDAFYNILYFLGKRHEKPRFDRFSYIEKFDYWAVYWGCVIMIGSGALLWFQDVSLRFLPKFMLDIAKEAHSDEALLATLAIFIWHFYNVHLNAEKFPGSLTWWHGKITRREMIEEHPLEYERLLAAGELPPLENGEGGEADGPKARAAAASREGGDA